MPLMPTDVDIKIWLKQNHDWLYDCMCHFRKHDLFITIGLFCTIFQVPGKPSSNYGVQDYATSEKENVKYSVIGRRVFSCRNLRAYILFWFNVILWFLTQHPSHIEYGHDNVIKWKHVPRYWAFVREIHRLPENSPHKGQWRKALMFSLICARLNGRVINREAGDLRRHRTHYDVTVMGTMIYNSARAKYFLKYTRQKFRHSSVVTCKIRSPEVEAEFSWFYHW